MQVQHLVNTYSFSRMPDFIRQSIVFRHIKHITKPFNMIGLPNMLEKCEANFDGKPSYIGFTASNVQGFWDLATMSMRGVMSCMHWDNMQHCHALLGSITDPFLGMIYITDKSSTNYGARIIRRSLVRFVRNEHPTRKSYELLLERVYKDTGNTNPLKYENKDPDANNTMDIFQKFLTSKVHPDYKVYDKRFKGYDTYGNYYQYMPRSTSFDYVSPSMSDCYIPYGKCKDAFIAQFTNQN